MKMGVVERKRSWVAMWVTAGIVLGGPHATFLTTVLAMGSKLWKWKVSRRGVPGVPALSMAPHSIQLSWVERRLRWIRPWKTASRLKTASPAVDAGVASEMSRIVKREGGLAAKCGKMRFAVSRVWFVRRICRSRRRSAGAKTHGGGPITEYPKRAVLLRQTRASPVPGGRRRAPPKLPRRRPLPPCPTFLPPGPKRAIVNIANIPCSSRCSRNPCTASVATRP